MTRAHELGEAFDREFAAAPPAPELAHSDFVCIRAAGQPWAIPLGDITSLHVDLRIVPLPSRAPELLGVAAVRASIVPIYDLGAALAGAGARAPRWTVVLRRAAGFAFEEHLGYARVADRAVAASAQRGHVRSHFTLDGQPLSILDLGSVLTAIETRWRPHRAAKDS